MNTYNLIDRENDSGEITVEGKQVEWCRSDGSVVCVNLHEVVVVGEYTTSAGPFADDWFLVFVLRSGEWKAVSVYAEGYNELANELSKFYGLNFEEHFLCASTEWRSFIRYPASLKGNELFKHVPSKSYKPPTSLFQNFKRAFGLDSCSKDRNIELTPEVKNELLKP
ncbi:MAG: hypothetical protein ACTHMM_00595 [Agriterribacter sp.]